jgi:hypothetical protein
MIHSGLFVYMPLLVTVLSSLAVVELLQHRFQLVRDGQSQVRGILT